MGPGGSLNLLNFFFSFRQGRVDSLRWNSVGILPTQYRSLQGGKLIITHYSFDPLGQPTVTAGRDHFSCTCLSVRTSVRPHFSKSETEQWENDVRYWRDCGSGRVDHWWHLSFFWTKVQDPLSPTVIYNENRQLELICKKM